MMFSLIPVGLTVYSISVSGRMPSYVTLEVRLSRDIIFSLYSSSDRRSVSSCPVINEPLLPTVPLTLAVPAMLADPDMGNASGFSTDAAAKLMSSLTSPIATVVSPSLKLII